MVAWIVCLVFLVVIIYLYYYLKCSHYRRLGNVIPGPSGLPFIGNALMVSNLGSNTMEYWKQQHTMFGSTWKLWLGPVLVVTITDPHDVHIVLNSCKTFSKPAPYKLFRLLLGNALFVSESEDWKRFRRIMDPAFNVQTLATFVKTFYAKSNILVQVIAKHAGGPAFDLEDYMMECSLDTIAETIFGVDTSVDEQNKILSVKNFQNIKSGFYHLVMKPWFWLECVAKMLPAYKNFVHLAKPILDYVDAIIVYKKMTKSNTRMVQKCVEENVSENRKKYMGFLDLVIDCVNSHRDFITCQELRDQTLGLMVGGLDTTALTMSIVLMLLGFHEDVQRRVVEELEGIFGSDVHKEVDQKDLKRMVYLEQVINEAMRLFPVSPVVARQAQDDIVLSRYTLPAGTTIVIPILHMQRDPEYIPRPHEFDPDRFNTSTAEKWRQFSFIPFTAGRRICIAKNYSYMQMKTMLSCILRNYKIIPCGSRDEMECLQFELMLKLVHGYKVKIKKREWKGTEFN